jgi:hypothetical protein
MATSMRPRARQQRRWSQRVTQSSNAHDLEPGVFRKRAPRQIAASLKRSAERSRRRRTDPFPSAMSMITFYVNRAGKQLSEDRQEVLDRAKEELRKLFGRSRKHH